MAGRLCLFREASAGNPPQVVLYRLINRIRIGIGGTPGVLLRL